jgi:hypothetical protein
LNDSSISTIESDITRGEVPPHPYPPPCLRRSGYAQAGSEGGGMGGGGPLISFLCNIKVYFDKGSEEGLIYLTIRIGWGKVTLF